MLHRPTLPNTHSPPATKNHTKICTHRQIRVNLQSVKRTAFRCSQEMSEKTQAIVLAATKYKDNATMLHLYTAEGGRMSYVVYGNKYKGLLTPLSVIEVTYADRNGSRVGKGLPVVSSVALAYMPKCLPTDVRRQCVAMFIAEILNKTLRHPMQDKELFAWLCGVIQELDETDRVENLHLRFLIDYTMFLGIGIDATEHTTWLEVPRNRAERQAHLREICAYYQEHIEDFTEPKSLDVLMAVFD